MKSQKDPYILLAALAEFYRYGDPAAVQELQKLIEKHSILRGSNPELIRLAQRTKGAFKAACQDCGKSVLWVPLQNGRHWGYDPNGLEHRCRVAPAVIV